MKNENMINASLLALRVVIGAIFAVHGAQKLFGAFDGIGLEGTAKLMEGLGFSDTYMVAIIWSSVEFVGGIFLLMGILARWSAVAIVLLVLIGLWKVNFAYGSFVQSSGMERDLLIAGGCIPLILLGGGSWSVWDA